MRVVRLLIARERADPFFLTTPRISIECVGTIRDLMYALAHRSPAVLLLDLQMAGIGGLPGLTDFRQLCPFAQIILLAERPDRDEAIKAVELGAIGYCDARAQTERLLLVVEMLQGVDIGAARKPVGLVLDEVCGSGMRDLTLDRLTAREREIVHLLRDGSSNKEIASALHVSVATVKAHLTHVFRKLKQTDRLHLALLIGRGSSLSD